MIYISSCQDQHGKHINQRIISYLYKYPPKYECCGRRKSSLLTPHSPNGSKQHQQTLLDLNDPVKPYPPNCHEKDDVYQELGNDFES